MGCDHLGVPVKSSGDLPASGDRTTTLACSQNRAPIGVAEVAIHFGYRGQRRPGVGATWTLSVGTFKEGPGVYVRAPPHVACHGTYSCLAPLWGS